MLQQAKARSAVLLWESCFTLLLLLLLAVSFLTRWNVIEVFDGLQCNVGSDWMILVLYNTHSYAFE
jgi:hypothetical protein